MELADALFHQATMQPIALEMECPAGFVGIRKRDALRAKVAQRSISRPAIVLRV
jgi:hypothetical protein